MQCGLLMAAYPHPSIAYALHCLVSLGSAVCCQQASSFCCPRSVSTPGHRQGFKINRAGLQYSTEFVSPQRDRVRVVTSVHVIVIDLDVHPPAATTTPPLFVVVAVPASPMTALAAKLAKSPIWPRTPSNAQSRDTVYPPALAATVEN